MYLGIWGYSADVPRVGSHDAGAAIVRHDGKILAAVNEERFTRRKNEGAFPFASIEEVMKIVGAAPKDLQGVAMAGLSPRRRSWKMLRHQWRLYRDTGIIIPHRLLYAALTAKKIKRWPPKKYSFLPRCELGHHDCHAAGAFFTGPLESATVITLDGIGDSANCGTVYRGEKGELHSLYEFTGYYSPGLLYSTVTERFGFKSARHEGKVTGLSAYGDPEVCARDFEKLISYRPEKKDFFSKFVPKIFHPHSSVSIDDRPPDELDLLVDQYKREDIAAALQLRTEQVVCEMIRDAIHQTGCSHLCLSGGVFANVRLNQSIAEMKEVESIYIFPHMGDGGLAMGAALMMASKRHSLVPRMLKTCFLGNAFSDIEMEEALKIPGVSYSRVQDPEEKAASALATGKIVGRFTGKMEYGPRTLGNRSILADPRNKTINDWLNQRLQRTEFMPFAPSILAEQASDFFPEYRPSHPAARFMTVTYTAFAKAKELAPAVIHLDETARPQVVLKKENPSFHRLISMFYEKTKVPMIINTSFNAHEEPIVCRPQEAVRALQEGRIDMLVMGPFVAVLEAL